MMHQCRKNMKALRCKGKKYLFSVADIEMTHVDPIEIDFDWNDLSKIDGYFIQWTGHTRHTFFYPIGIITDTCDGHVMITQMPCSGFSLVKSTRDGLTNYDEQPISSIASSNSLVLPFRLVLFLGLRSAFSPNSISLKAPFPRCVTKGMEPAEAVRARLTSGPVSRSLSRP